MRKNVMMRRRKISQYKNRYSVLRKSFFIYLILNGKNNLLYKT